jgi:hypothetical protein
MTCRRITAWPEPPPYPPGLRGRVGRGQATRSCSGASSAAEIRGAQPRRRPTVRDHSTASRGLQARPALGTPCAQHGKRRPGRGPRLRPPSSRFHGFDPQEPDRAALRTGIDSLTFSIKLMRSPGSGSHRTDGSQDEDYTTDIRWRLIGQQKKRRSGHQTLRHLHGASPITANQPSQTTIRD